MLSQSPPSATPSDLINAAGLAILGTVVFALLVALLGVIRRFLFARLASATWGFKGISFRGFTLLSRANLIVLVRRIVGFVTLAVGLFGAYVWLAYILTRFEYTRPWGEALGSYLSNTVGQLALAALEGIPSLFTAALILIVTRWFVQVVNKFFDAVEGGVVQVSWMHRETARPTKRIVAALIWLFGVVAAYPYLPGSSSDVFKGVSVFAGLVLTLGSSGLMNQVMSGLVLMYARALRPGDYVIVGATEGTVLELGMLATKIRSTTDEVVTLPNAVVVAATIKNFSRSSRAAGQFMATSLTVGYETPWRQVEALLLMAAQRTNGIVAEPKPFVLKTLRDFYVEYQLNVMCERPAERVFVFNRLNSQILDLFNEYGVQLTSPHYQVDPKAPMIVPPERWYAPPAELSSNAQSLPEPERPHVSQTAS